MRIGLCLLALLAPLAWSQEAHRHKAHVHGVAALDIAIEGKTVTAIFESPADSIMGFEHLAKAPAEIKKRDEALAKLKARFGEMLLMPASAQCAWKPGKAEVHLHGSHADVEAEFTAECKGPLNRGEIRFAFMKVFPDVHELKIQLIGPGQQTGAVIKHDEGTVKLGR